MCVHSSDDAIACFRYGQGLEITLILPSLPVSEEAASAAFRQREAGLTRLPAQHGRSPLPEATDRQITGLQLIRELQKLPAAVLERPVRVYVEATRGTGGKGTWTPVVGVSNTADSVEIALEDE